MLTHLDPGRSDYNFQCVIFKHIYVIDVLSVRLSFGLIESTVHSAVIRIATVVPLMAYGENSNP